MLILSLTLYQDHLDQRGFKLLCFDLSEIRLPFYNNSFSLLLRLSPNSRKKDVEKTIYDGILAKGELIGLYAKK